MGFPRPEYVRSFLRLLALSIALFCESSTSLDNNMRLFIADEDKQLRVALQILLHQEPGMQVIGVATEAKGLLARVKASEPDVLLLDWNLPGIAVSELVADLRALELPPKIVILAVRPEVENAAMAAGADAFVSKNGSPQELLAFLSTIMMSKS
jgi:DNA-binding NarL/FixJ family response regulator